VRKTGDSFDRAVPLHVTIERANSLRTRYGITRVADLTYLDRIGIPVVNVFVPNSPDRLGVYNGKGLTRDHAIASGLMEALERQICARCEIERFAHPIPEVMQHIDLQRVNWIGPDEGDVECVWGGNLLSGERIAVPLGLTQNPRQSARVFSYTSTNGLASGNNATEAIYHALFELCERHLFSRLHILAHMWPRSLRARGGDVADQPDDPLANGVRVDPDTPLIGELVQKIERTGLQFRLIAYAPSGWPIGMMATVSSHGGGDAMYYHLGFGCSWSPLHAAVRAITEAAQVRLADISGTREDLKYADAQTAGFEHGKRPGELPGGRWYYDGPVEGQIAIDDLADHSHPDLDVELRMLLDMLRSNGERCVAYVDLTPPDVPVSVARVIAPTLERTLVDGTLSPQMASLLANPLSPIR
jgi:ribosomal protein S12 methylthiotransferase accessory factor